VVGAIDAVRCPIEKPKNPELEMATYSGEKKINLVKYVGS
jgi:hypothetical protein